jgi:hypothetical protein
LIAVPNLRAHQIMPRAGAQRAAHGVCPVGIHYYASRVSEDVRSWPVSDQVIAYRRRNSHLSLLGHFQRVIHFYTEIADRAFELCMT